eukprot:GHUV01037942.1.p1 GENE.GHUV01037942.1~~GHUV01037942.1.p1  ORF type:complete len:143 (+),score=8.54 GHUV01037942.1:128-556(+)
MAVPRANSAAACAQGGCCFGLQRINRLIQGGHQDTPMAHSSCCCTGSILYTFEHCVMSCDHTLSPVAESRSLPGWMLITVVLATVFCFCSLALLHTNRRWCTERSWMRKLSMTASSSVEASSAFSSQRSPAAADSEIHQPDC